MAAASDLTAAEAGQSKKSGLDFHGRKTLFTESMSQAVRDCKDDASTEKPQFWTLPREKQLQVVHAVVKKTLFDPQAFEKKEEGKKTKCTVTWSVSPDILLGGFTVACEEKKIETTKEEEITVIVAHSAYVNSYGVLESATQTMTKSSKTCLIM
eukprot:gb/GEZN01021070.1/.p1 GENE.gb/GEZN01021070.1/~~gb/GEZN01021070.1/.p1  ORF type:complete len:154 (-),score=33.23 gb/GEZN01021070.1/:121-582(-)